MKSMRKLVVAFTSVLLIGLAFSAFGDGLPDEQLPLPQPPVMAGGYTGLYLDDTTNFTGFPSSLIGVQGSTGRQTAAWACTSVTDTACSQAAYFQYLSYLSPCLSDAENNCLEGISATTPTGTVEKATLVRKFPESFGVPFKGEVTKNLPDSGSPSLWQFPTVKHSGGNLFLATPNFSDWSYQTTRTTAATLSAGIYPVGLLQGSYPIPVTQPSSNLPGLAISTRESTPDCAMTDGSNCAKIYPFPANTRFSMSIRTNMLVRGFLHGRIDDPNITYTKDSNGVVHLAVEAAPVTVPVFGVWAKNTDLPPALNTYLDLQSMGGRFYYTDGSGNRAGTALLRDGRNTGYTQQSLNEFTMWLPVAQDKAYGLKSVWGFKTLQDQGGTSPCYSGTDALTGMVTTNSTMYEAAPPTFNTQTQSLDYKVASPHFDKTGGVNSGKYSLVLNSAAARCLYKFSSAPVKATISILSADGSTQVASTVVNEKDGWLHMQASGFTYSSPTITVKLTQEAPAPVVTPSPTPTPTPVVTPSSEPTMAPVVKPSVAPKKTTITCVKGKTTKTVTAVKPTCPVGYKKK
jgi:hypothetical protein